MPIRQRQCKLEKIVFKKKEKEKATFPPSRYTSIKPLVSFFSNRENINIKIFIIIQNIIWLSSIIDLLKYGTYKQLAYYLNAFKMETKYYWIAVTDLKPEIILFTIQILFVRSHVRLLWLPLEMGRNKKASSICTDITRSATDWWCKPSPYSLFVWPLTSNPWRG